MEQREPPRSILGAEFVPASEAGRLDKCFSDQLEPNANEIHAANMSDGYLQGWLHSVWKEAPQDRVVMLNQKIANQNGDPPVLYAQAVVETVKMGLKRFRACLVADRWPTSMW